MKPAPLLFLFFALNICAGVANAAADKSALIRIGDGIVSKGDLNGKSLALAKAFEALPATGGRIEILPGTYEAEGSVSLQIPNVMICGSGGATRIAVKGSAHGRSAWDFLSIAPLAQGFVLRDCAIEWQAGDGERALILSQAPDARFENCRFALESRKGEGKWATCLHIAGTEQPMARNIWIVGNQFDLGDWGRGVRLERLDRVFVSGNAFDCRRAEPGQCLLSASCNRQQFTGNTFMDGGQHDGPNPSYGLLIDNPGGDASHAEITGNQFHTFFGSNSRALKLGNAYFTTVTGNVIGRIQGEGNAAIEVLAGHGITISGNQIENCNPGSEGAVVLVAGPGGFSLASNVFSSNYATGVQIDAGAVGGFGISLLANTFSCADHPLRHAVVVRGNGARGITIAHNVFDHCLKEEAVGYTPQESLVVKDNIELAPMTQEQIDTDKTKVKPRSKPVGQAPTAR